MVSVPYGVATMQWLPTCHHALVQRPSALYFASNVLMFRQHYFGLVQSVSAGCHQYLGYSCTFPDHQVELRMQAQVLRATCNSHGTKHNTA